MAHVYVLELKIKERRNRWKFIGYRCNEHRFMNEPGLYLCKVCQAKVDAGAEIRIPFVKKLKGTGIVLQCWKKYGVRRGGWNGIIQGRVNERDIEIGECKTKDALLDRAKKLIYERENAEAMARFRKEEPVEVK